MNAETLKIDLAENAGIFKGVNSDTKEKYIKLETRLKGIIDNLIENTDESHLDLKAISFLKLITTSNSVIPFKFFTFFEIARLNLSKETVIDLNNNQMALILCIYLICKILIKVILVDLKFSPNIKNITVKK